jgi:hypothetical protein
MSRSWQGVVASQERGASPALPLAEVEVLALEQVAVSAVVSSAEVLPAAKVGEVASSAQVVATAVVVPLRAAAEGDDDTAAAQVVPGRANEVVPSRAVSSQRGGSETRIATGPGHASVVLLLEKVLPTERSHSGGWGGQRRASIAGRGLRPSWRLLESVSTEGAGSGIRARETGSGASAQQRRAEQVLARGRPERWGAHE